MYLSDDRLLFIPEFWCASEVNTRRRVLHLFDCQKTERVRIVPMTKDWRSKSVLVKPGGYLVQSVVPTPAWRHVVGRTDEVLVVGHPSLPMGKFVQTVDHFGPRSPYLARAGPTPKLHRIRGLAES